MSTHRKVSKGRKQKSQHGAEPGLQDKTPRSISFISDEDMPRTATGKILHRYLRQK
jgi:acyl-coenzyme A synthetase/AMP-(fatty) acid ligase